MAADPVSQPRRLEELGASGEGSSRVRARFVDGRTRAARRVAEYLRALGLSDPERIAAIADASVRASEAARGEASPQDAVADVQRRYATYLHDVFGPRAEDIDPLWLRAFFVAHPEACLGDLATARRAASQFGDPWAGRPPARRRFREQRFRRARVPRWIVGLMPPLLLCTGATGALAWVLSAGGLTPVELAWTALFAALFGLGAIGCCTALYGWPRAPAPRPLRGSDLALPRSALVMPIYHEDSERVFAAVAAMRESLASTPGGETFEIFVLSDSRLPEQVAEEERAWRRIACWDDAPIPVYYRRRARNDRQKAGNLAEFFERWGHRYSYAVVLDADSLMHGDTMVELVRRMEAAPRLALLQAPLTLHRGATCFARAQQLAASTSGPLFTRGLARWAGPHGNYYGHNAVLRVRAFLECCALPVLAGEPPLGGHILSHDFVEAALLCRAGWEVRMADDLGGSYEELPASLPAYVARDRRWCQGNLQHLRVAMAEGLAPMSRIHMWVGAGAYLAGPAWLMLLVLGLHLARTSRGWLAHGGALGVLLATGVMLLGPRVLGVSATLRERERRLAHGGAARVCIGAAAETLLSALLAPLLMVHHTRIVLSVAIGHAVSWKPQRRADTESFTAIVRSELPATLLGACLCGWLAHTAPELLWWVAPVWAPLCLAIPLAALASSRKLGQWLARCGILTVPSETCPDDLALRAEELRSLTASDETARFRDLLLDPLLVKAQLARLAQAPPPDVDRATLSRICQRALRMGPAALTAAERHAITHDPESLRALHLQAWCHWPVESWDLARDQPQLPSER